MTTEQHAITFHCDGKTIQTTGREDLIRTAMTGVSVCATRAISLLSDEAVNSLASEVEGMFGTEFDLIATITKDDDSDSVNIECTTSDGVKLIAGLAFIAMNFDEASEDDIEITEE